jgi:2,4-diaminopentanoate dehydrogenase
MTTEVQEKTLRVVCLGLGPIGSALAAQCESGPGFELVQAVDPARAGETVAGVEVEESLDTILAADLALLATGSSVAAITPDCERLFAEGGLDVVTSCEDLAYPFLSDPEAAERLDGAAREAGRTVLAAGVNPGFAMDLLPVLAASACLEPTEVRVERQVDLSSRRGRLSEKFGVGLEESEWHESGGAEVYGHRGLVESLHLCAVGVGPAGTDLELTEPFRREPVVEGGTVVGIRERVAGVWAGGSRSALLELVFRRDGENRDTVEIGGPAPVRFACEGLNGDQATVARMLSSARNVAAMPAGLRLSLEAPAWNGAGVGPGE